MSVGPSRLAVAAGLLGSAAAASADLRVSGAPQIEVATVHERACDFFAVDCGTQTAPDVAASAAGTFAVASRYWISSRFGVETHVVADLFAASGARVAESDMGGAFGGDVAESPAVAMSPGGGFVVVWRARKVS